MKQTIIYGGAFNPPTIAHEIILKACLDYARKNNADLWIIPSGNRLDKKIVSDRQTRVNYIKAMIDDIGADGIIKIITDELDRDKFVETYDTVNELADKYPNRLFIWVFGADSVETMSTWKEGNWLLGNLKMLVIRRSDCNVNSLPINKSTPILDVVTPDVSSTEVRRRLEADESIDDLVGSAVRKIINKNR